MFHKLSFYWLLTPNVRWIILKIWQLRFFDHYLEYDFFLEFNNNTFIISSGCTKAYHTILWTLKFEPELHRATENSPCLFWPHLFTRNVSVAPENDLYRPWFHMTSPFVSVWSFLVQKNCTQRKYFGIITVRDNTFFERVLC